MSAPLGKLAGVLLLARRELASAFDSKIAYAVTIAGLLVVNSTFMTEFFLAGRLDLNPLFAILPLAFCFYLPAITMRAFAEERKQRTFELLVTLPFTPLQITLAKFLAGMAIVVMFLLGTLPSVFLLEWLGEPDRGRIAAGYFGALGLASALLALGLLLSSVTRDQVTAFVLAALAAVALVPATGALRFAAILDGVAPKLAVGSFLRRHVSLQPAYEELVGGLVDPSAVARIAVFTLVLLLATSWAVRDLRQ